MRQLNRAYSETAEAMHAIVSAVSSFQGYLFGRWGASSNQNSGNGWPSQIWKGRSK